MVVPSNLYTLLVQYPGDDIDAQPCSKVWMLVKAMEKSHWASAGSRTITTDNIQDAFDPVNFPETPKTATKKVGCYVHDGEHASFQIPPVPWQAPVWLSGR